MLLKSFKYKSPNWQIEGLDSLQPSNLLVGVNASGKTRTIKSILNTACFLRAQPSIFQEEEFTTELKFEYIEEDIQHELHYSFKVKDNIILEEKLLVDTEYLIKRTSKIATLDSETINPPDTKLIVQIRRDKIKHPEIELLMEWAEKVMYISFSDINSYTNFIAPSLNINPVSFSHLIEEFTPGEKRDFLKSASSLDYNISDISVKSLGELKIVEVKENYIKKKVDELRMSNGMIRVLYLIAFLTAIKESQAFSMLLVDDLGEGLDYARVRSVGRKIFEKCEDKGIQLIASSNDSCLMDIIDISKWQILIKERAKTNALNSSSHPSLFQEFSYTGLGNFDLFSSDIINSYLATQNK